MRLEKTAYASREEGSAMILGALGLIVAIMMMALMMDMGLYYSNYRKLKAASDFANEEIAQMLPYYAYSPDYVETFHSSLERSLNYLGYTSDNVVSSNIGRSTKLVTGWVISVSSNIELEDTYHCMFASIIGINEMPIRVAAKSVQSFSIGDPYYEGMPYEVWGEEGN